MQVIQNTSLTYLLVHWFVSAIAVLFTSKIISGFQVSNFFSALMAAFFIGLADRFLWPVFMFLTLPINLLTLGLFTFVVNGLVLKIAAAFVPGFDIKGFLAAIFGALFLAIISGLLHYIFV